MATKKSSDAASKKQIKALQTQLKKEKQDHKKTVDLWKAKYKVLKSQVNESIAAVKQSSYEKGYTDAINARDKFDDDFDRFMNKAAQQFEKEYLAKLKKQGAAKKKTKKTATKAKKTVKKKK